MDVLAVAMGEPKHIKRYCGKLAPGIDCLTGEKGGEEAYYAYGLQEGSRNQIASFDVLKAGARALSKGHIGGVPTGNTKMLPGTFVVDSNGRIAYAYYSKHIGDHPSIDDVVAAAKQLNK